jgi:site-specific recombinase XerD
MSCRISIVLDKRKAKKGGAYPVKLRVYSTTLNKDKRYSLNIDLTENQFNKIWVEGRSKTLKGTNQEMKIKFSKIENKADDVIKKLSYFSFEQFERKFFRKTTDSDNVYYHFNAAISQSIKKKKIGTSESFKYTLKSLQDYVKYTSRRNSLSFSDITPNWLDDYEQYMLDNDKSITTIAIYTRTLRVVFNNAIDDNDISKEIYPFGKKKYQIPESKKVKKALSKEELNILFESKPKTLEQEKAKDFWFFSYACNGINLKDIALLKYTDIKNGKFSYYRAKTFNKSRVKTKIEIYLTDYTNSIIEKYGLKDQNGFVFTVLKNENSIEENYKRIKNFTRFINQHLKQLAKDNNLPGDISSYWARHSFATNAIRKGASMEFISEALNHSDLNVTKHYFAGFEDKTKKEFAEKLMDF